MSLDELENDEFFSPQHKLEFREFQEITNKFHVYANRREGKELSNKELFILVSDYKHYQDEYQKALYIDNPKEAIRILLSTDPSILEDKKIMQTAKTWRIL